MCPAVHGLMLNDCMTEAEEGEEKGAGLMEDLGGLPETGGTWLALGR